MKFIDLSLPDDVVIHRLKDVINNENYYIEGLYLEKVRNMSAVSSNSNFKFGYNYGFIHGVLKTLKLPISLVPVAEWHKFNRITVARSIKGYARKKAIKALVASTASHLYPRVADDLYGVRGGLIDGRSDSLLIAHYCKMHNDKDFR